MVSAVRLATFPRIPFPLGSGLELPKEELEQDLRGSSKVFSQTWCQRSLAGPIVLTVFYSTFSSSSPWRPYWPTAVHSRLFRSSSFPQTRSQLPLPVLLQQLMGFSSQISLQALTCPPRPVLQSFLKGMTPSLILQLHFLDLLVPWSSHNCARFNSCNKTSAHTAALWSPVEPCVIRL